MAHRAFTMVAALLALGLAAGEGRGQERANPAARAKEEARTDTKIDLQDPLARCAPTATLRVQVVLTRFQNEKKEASLPYAFVVSSRPSGVCPEKKVRMRMGVDTPVPMTVLPSEAGVSRTTGSIQYKNIGTNLDCLATDLGDGRYQIGLYVENSSTLRGAQGGASGDLAGVPLFRSFSASVDPILRDGQSIQTVASTDPVTGEVVKIDVTLNVVK
jgi:hypothetical protein